MNTTDYLERGTEVYNRTFTCPYCGNQFCNVTLSLNNQQQYDALIRILDNMESVGSKAKEIKDVLYHKYAPVIEGLAIMLDDASKIKAEKSKHDLSRIALMAYDLESEILKDLELKLEYGKNRFADMKDSPEYKQNAVDALRLLAFMTLTCQITCRCLAAQDEYEICNTILQGYKEIVEKSARDQQNILLGLNSSNIFIEQGDLVYGFKQIIQQINAYKIAN